MVSKLILYIPIIFLFAFPSPARGDAGDKGSAGYQFVDPNKASDYFPYFNNAITGFKYNVQTTPGIIISAILPIMFTLAGLILFAMLILGGFQMMTSAGNPKGADAGKARLTSALIGFAIIFLAYWLTQFMEIIFGINIL